jgi:hypothetical protein
MALPSLLFDSLLKTLNNPFDWSYYKTASACGGRLYSSRFNMAVDFKLFGLLAFAAYKGNELDLTLFQKRKLAKVANKSRAARKAYSAEQAAKAEQERQREMLETLKDGLNHAEPN